MASISHKNLEGRVCVTFKISNQEIGVNVRQNDLTHHPAFKMRRLVFEIVVLHLTGPLE
jgi:hypothetical protein